jgi:hypothetical protein
VIINARVDEQGERIIARRWAGWTGARNHPVPRRGIADTQTLDVAEGKAAVFSRLWLPHRMAIGIVRYISIAIDGVYDQWVVPEVRVVGRVARHVREAS